MPVLPQLKRGVALRVPVSTFNQIKNNAVCSRAGGLLCLGSSPVLSAPDGRNSEAGDSVRCLGEVCSLGGWSYLYIYSILVLILYIIC